MDVLCFFVPGPKDRSGSHAFPGMNEVVAENRRGWGAGSKLKARMTERCERYARQAMEETGWVAPLGPVEVSLRWHEVSWRRDQDNVTSAEKFVLDGMVRAGVLRGDSHRYIPKPTTHEIVVDREHPGVTVEVSRIEEE